MPEESGTKRRGRPEADTEKWSVSVQTSTIATFERIAGRRARTLAARLLDDLADALERRVPKSEPGAAGGTSLGGQAT